MESADHLQPLHMTKADKNNRAVVLNLSDYERNVSEHLTRRSYEVIQKNKARRLTKQKLR